MAEITQHGFRLFVSASEYSAGVRGSLEQHGCFAIDNLEVLIFRDRRVAKVRELLHLALRNQVGRPRQYLHDAKIADFHHHLEGP